VKPVGVEENTSRMVPTPVRTGPRAWSLLDAMDPAGPSAIWKQRHHRESHGPSVVQGALSNGDGTRVSKGSGNEK